MKSLPLLLVGMLLLLPSLSEAQNREQPLSPRDSVFCLIDTNMISVNYGRPSMRGRNIMGELVPWHQVWRTGANEATHFKTNYDMLLGGVPVMRGTYTLFTLPSPTGWKIILNKQRGQWGTRYDATQDYARFDAIVEELPAPVETLTVAFDATGITSGRMKMMWEKTMVWTRFEKADNIRPVSPLDSTEVFLENRKVKVKYSKPFMRGREIWGVVVPFDSIWRTGANMATVLETEGDITIGGANVPAGTYTLYSKPAAKGFHLIVNRKGPGQASYDPSQDHAHVELTMKNVDKPVDPFTITLEPTGRSNTAILKLGWGDREYAADVVVK
ncbi:MAG: DUF2911 domain-containing protein [Bacteroidetes bacterium]|nr:DUF2911 domain-containing protein [Bacteroidota bacterium]MCW5895021.1 DUF2911 domain-containing protein [Bacteroidota bacterium]